MKRLSLICLLVFLPVLGSTAGIPVIDATAIARQITQYQQTLRDYSNQLRQLGVENNQYLQMVKDYNQQIKEYQIYLRQVKGLKSVISRQDWDGLFHKVSSYYGSSSYAQIATMTGTGNTLRDQIDRRVGEVYTVPATPSVVGQEMGQVVDDPALWVSVADKQRVLYEQYRSQMEIVARNNAELKDREEQVNRLKGQLSLDDKSDLLTLQNIASSNYHVIGELQAGNQIQNQILLHQNEERIRELAAAEELRRREYQRLLELQNRPVQQHTFHWSDVDL